MASSITGTTRLYGLVGHPLRDARSPQLLNRFFIEHGVDAVCVPLDVPAEGLDAFVTGARSMNNLAGILVTMPHKRRMLDVVDELHPTARQVGSINVIRCDTDGRWIGAIFDGLGCVLGMQSEGHSPANKKVLLVGAGGAGRAIAFAVASAGARSLTIADVDPSRADDLARSVAAETGCTTHAGAPDPRDHDIVINATPLGMSTQDPMPVDPRRLTPGTTVVDITNAPEPTALCLAALERGCRIQDGGPMHRGQALLAMRFLGFDDPSAQRAQEGI